MNLILNIQITRTVKYRGGREIKAGTILRAAAVEGGYAVAHPNGMEGVYAHVPATHATLL